MDRLLDIMSWLSLALILLVLISIRRAHIRVENSISWLTAATAMFILTSWRGLLDNAANVMGLPGGVFALLLATGVMFLLVIFRLSIRLSELKDSNIALAQRIAILEYNLVSVTEKVRDEKVETSHNS